MPDPVIEHVLAAGIERELELSKDLAASVARLIQAADDACRHRRAGKDLHRRLVRVAAIAHRVRDVGQALANPGRIAP